jgi:2-polyprenyl-3-methyl-5-hydroxy-6-metoxy-1,4-benzoquinol methylase
MEHLMYDSLSSDYDRFVNWQKRLAIELPFIIQQLQQINARSILDAATGTGMHAIALAQLGYQTAGADISTGMIRKTRTNAISAGVQVQFEVAGFGALAHTFGMHSFDALLCLGNSLPHLLSRPELDAALLDFATCLKPGGLLMIQNRNFNAIMSHHDRWMEPQSHTEPGAEWIFQRFYEFDPDSLLTFNMVTLKREDQGNWTQKVDSSRLRPLLQDELVSALMEAGFVSLVSYGNMSGDAFDPETSGNLIITARPPG